VLVIIGTVLGMYALLLLAPPVCRWVRRRHWLAKRAACKRLHRQRWLGRKLAVVLAVLLVAGCGEVVPPALMPTGSAVAKAAAFVEAARPHATPPGPALLDRASQELASAGKSLEAAAVEQAKLAQAVAVKDARLAEYHNRWIGDATWRALRKIIIWSIAIWAGLGIVSALLGGLGAGGLFGTVARVVLNGMPLANPFTWLARRLNNR
jgi:hypothetical protein